MHPLTRYGGAAALLSLPLLASVLISLASEPPRSWGDGLTRALAFSILGGLGGHLSARWLLRP